MNTQHTPVVIAHDFRPAGNELARVASFDEAREWFMRNPEFVPVKRSYLCGVNVHKVSAVDRFGPFAHREIAL